MKHRLDMALVGRPKPAPEATLLNIRTREELINALQEATQVEHGLMLQYLFAAISFKKFAPREGITERQAEKARDWEARILKIARDEMAHLATACNLLNAIGGSPNFNRPNFPQPAYRWFPFEYALFRFSEKTLERFIRFESPRPSSEVRLMEIAPIPITYEYIGELYRSIAVGFSTVADTVDSLFVGADLTQDEGDWTGNLRIPAIRDVAGAQDAIDFIVKQGEGTPEGIKGSHFGEFSTILEELRAEKLADPHFDPARPVVDNPLTRAERDAGSGFTLLEPGTLAHQVAELFNHVYCSLLLMLMQLFNPAGESAQQRTVLRESSRRAMSGIVRPLAELLTQLPASKTATTVAGPPFELYGDLRLPAYPTARWTILLERLQAEEREAARLTASGELSVSRLTFLTRNLRLLRETLSSVGA